MATLSINAENLSEGDTLVLPFNKTATVKKVQKVGPRSIYVMFTTEYGKMRVCRFAEVHVEAKVI